jgi:hypothetical protein
MVDLSVDGSVAADVTSHRMKGVSETVDAPAFGSSRHSSARYQRWRAGTGEWKRVDRA